MTKGRRGWCMCGGQPSTLSDVSLEDGGVVGFTDLHDGPAAWSASDTETEWYDAREAFTPSGSPDSTPGRGGSGNLSLPVGPGAHPEGAGAGAGGWGAGVGGRGRGSREGLGGVLERQLAYDAALLQYLNRLYGSDAKCISELPQTKVLPEMMVDKDGYRGGLTKSQTLGLAAFRAKYPESRRTHTDDDMLKFLRARDFDLPAVYKMFDRYCSVYRAKFFVSPFPVVRPIVGTTWPAAELDLLIGHAVTRDDIVTGRMQRLFDYFMSGMIYGCDKQGRPVVYLRVATAVLRSYGKHVPLEDRLAMQAASMEMHKLLCHVATARTGTHIEGIVQVMDLGDVPISSLLGAARNEDSKKEAELNADFFPEILHKVHVLNTPFGMSTVFSIVKAFLPPKTAYKVNLYGSSDYQAVLREQIGAERLPSVYGGDFQFTWPEKREMNTLPERV